MLRSLVHGLTELVFPRICLACKEQLKAKQAHSELLCADCWKAIEKNPPPYCHCCGRHLECRRPLKNMCTRCSRRHLSFDRAFAPCRYQGVTRELIRQFKYGNKDHVGPLLSTLMIDFIKSYPLPIEYMDAIVPVALHKERLWEREFNQAEVLAGRIAMEFDKPLLTGTLTRNRSTRTQTELRDDERFDNVRGSFSVIDPSTLRGNNILLVDDVLTTGATASEAALALKGAGANIVFVVTLAN